MASLTSTEVLQRTFGNAELVRRIQASNVLLVGAGGIGCEVLKGLLLTGFPKITIVDLDTIDVSNLNRQFLYNKSHVGQSKAQVAARVSVERFAHRDPTTGESISQVNPIHDSILSPNYDQDFYREFTFVINALDNNSTRVHVNRMCQSTRLPLVESASAGYFGNVRLIKAGVTTCFECEKPKKDENTYASCTIRNTPSLPIHCIVWAKHLFAQLFGLPDEEDISPDPVASNVSAENGSSTTEENSEEKKEVKLRTRDYVEANGYDPKLLFDKIFYQDVLYLHEMKDLWAKRRQPRCVQYEQVISGEMNFESEKGPTTSNGLSNGSAVAEKESEMAKSTRLWSANECLEVFVSSLATLKERYQKQGTLEWDKDDEASLNFVAAVSNFRCHCFFIPRKSKFDVKALAGNIIPAISSTNTIVGGYVLLETIKMLESLLPCRVWKTTAQQEWREKQALAEGVTLEEWIAKNPERPFRNEEIAPLEECDKENERLFKNCFAGYITNHNGNHNIRKTCLEPLRLPNPECMVCSGKVKEIIVALPLSKMTLADLLEQVVIKKLKCISPDIIVNLKTMLWCWEDEEELREANSRVRTKLLSDYPALEDSVKLEIVDHGQDFRIRLELRDQEFDPEKNEGEVFKILNQDELDRMHESTSSNGATTNGETIVETMEKEEDNLEPIEINAKSGLKRPRSEEHILVDEDDECMILEHTKRVKTL